MSNRIVFYALILSVLVIVVWIISDTLDQPSVVDLEGEFVETAFYRNENNTGPVVRIYAVHTPDTSWNAMKAFGEFMPHTKYGNTKVYFFNTLENSPKEIRPEKPHFDQIYEPFCLGFYEKNAMGQERFVQFPFKD
ncbi:MAG: hypothetical protein ACXIUQ_18370 [Cecembia sp.]